MRRFQPLLGLAIALAFLALAFRRVEWTEVAATVRRADALLLGVGLLALAAGFGMRIVRWWVMLRAFNPRLPVRRCAAPFLAGLAVNNTVPLRAGDLLRAFGFRTALGSPPLRVLGTLVIERVLDLLSLLVVLAAALWGAPPGTVPDGFLAVATAAGGAGVAGLVLLVARPRWLRRLLVALRRGGAPGRRAARWSREFVAAFGLLRSSGRALALVALSLTAWGLEGGMYAAVVASLGSVVPPLASWLALATGTLATLLPSTPGYVGTFDYFAALGLRAYGLPASQAVAGALTIHLLLWLPVTAAGAVALALARTGGGPVWSARATVAAGKER